MKSPRRFQPPLCCHLLSSTKGLLCLNKSIKRYAERSILVLKKNDEKEDTKDERPILGFRNKEKMDGVPNEEL